MHGFVQPNRRQVVAGLTAGLASTVPVLAQGRNFSVSDYRQAVVIDAQGGFSDTTAGAMKAVRQSGITAASQTVGLVGNGPGRFDSVVSDIAQVQEAIDSFPDTLMLLRRTSDLTAAKKSGRVGIIFNLQDTTALDGDLSRVETLKGLGLRVIQLTYNKRNLCGDGCLEPANEGVSDFGRQVIHELNTKKILLDLSHGGERTILEAASLTRSPPAITHTGCRDLINTPRNVRDVVLRAIADKGGVVGIYFMSYLCSGIGDTPRNPRREDLFAHLEHAIKICGEDHVGIGTDNNDTPLVLDASLRAIIKKYYEDRVAQGVVTPGDGPDIVNYIPEYNTPERFLPLAQDLSQRGWPASRIEKILGGNFARLFGEVWDA